MFSLLADFELFVLHAFVHFFEGAAFILEVFVLLSQNLLVIVEEIAEVVQFRFFQHLEAVEGC